MTASRTMKFIAVLIISALVAEVPQPLASATVDISSLLTAKPVFVQSIVNTLPGLRLPMSKEKWSYLRKGLNYIEVSGRNVSADFVHPGGCAYGPLALTRIAVKDVQLRYKEISRYDFEDIISDDMLYEDFAILYADMLLGHYLKLKYQSMPDNEVFQILQRAWFWGPTIYRKGPGKIGPRERMAAEYLNNTINGAISCKSTQGN